MFEITKVKGEHGATFLIESLILLDHSNNNMPIFNQLRL